MNKQNQNRVKACCVLVLSAWLLSGCVGMAINTATDAALAVAKVPFKVGGAVVDVVTD